LLAWLQLIAVDEHDAAVAVSRLSRANLCDDGYGARVLDAVDEWLRAFNLALRNE
jgi:hypothetical protein